MADTIGTQFRLPPELHERLKTAAEARGLTVNRLAVGLLTESLEALLPAEEICLTSTRRDRLQAEGAS